MFLNFFLIFFYCFLVVFFFLIIFVIILQGYDLLMYTFNLGFVFQFTEYGIFPALISLPLGLPLIRSWTVSLLFHLFCLLSGLPLSQHRFCIKRVCCRTPAGSIFGDARKHGLVSICIKVIILPRELNLVLF